MALFPRRVLQRTLSENVTVLSPAQADSVCRQLNVAHDGYVALEWEQVLLNAASKAGGAKYEPPLGGKSRADLLLKIDDPPLEFVADITACSDRGLDELNPMEALMEEFQLQLRKRNIPADGFNVQLDGWQGSIYRGSK